MDPFPTTGNPGSMLERALANYFVAGGIGVWAITVAGQTLITPADNTAVLPYPNIKILAHTSMHDPQQTGNEVYDVVITAKFSLAGNPNPANPFGARVARDLAIGQVMYAMMLSSGENGNMPLDQTVANITQYGRAVATQGSVQEQANNADMAEFTCFAVYFTGSARGIPDGEGNAYAEVRHFKIEVCPSAIN